MTRRVSSYRLPILALLAKSDRWVPSIVIVGHLRDLVPPEKATRRLVNWCKTTDIYAMPAEELASRGAKVVIRTKLSDFKCAGLIEQRGSAGDPREYRITDKGRRKLETLKGNGHA